MQTNIKNIEEVKNFLFIVKNNKFTVVIIFPDKSEGVYPVETPEDIINILNESKFRYFDYVFKNEIDYSTMTLKMNAIPIVHTA